VECVVLSNGAGFIQFGLEPMAVRVGEEYCDKIHMWREIQEHLNNPVGASLLAMTACQSIWVLNVNPLSRASSLPQWNVLL
jgi:hypothetical protein